MAPWASVLTDAALVQSATGPPGTDMTDGSRSPSSHSSLLVGWTGDPVPANGSLDVSGGLRGEGCLPASKGALCGEGAPWPGHTTPSPGLGATLGGCDARSSGSHLEAVRTGSANMHRVWGEGDRWGGEVGKEPGSLLTLLSSGGAGLPQAPCSAAVPMWFETLLVGCSFLFAKAPQQCTLCTLMSVWMKDQSKAA